MTAFYFNHLKGLFAIIISLGVMILGFTLIKQGVNYESKVLIDTNGVLLVLAGTIFITYGFIETRLIWIAINLPPTNIKMVHDQIEIFENKKVSKIHFSKIKKITFSESELSRRTISNDIEFSKIETYDQGSFIITSFIISPQKLDILLKVPHSKKIFTENKFLKKIS